MVSPIKNKFCLILNLSLILTLSYPIFAPCFAQNRKYVRVAIARDIVSFALFIRGDYQVIDPVNNIVLLRGKRLNGKVGVYKAGIVVGRFNFKNNRVLIKTFHADIFAVNNRYFRGDIQIIKKADEKLLVVNYLDLEDYIKGVLYHEVSHHWPIEALKAQAVACRTYASSQIEAGISQDYDLTADIYSQVYGGRTSERYRTNRAVELTKYQVLNFQGKIFPTYYHATCAGHTQDASSLWKIDLVPLRGLVCNFCVDSPHFKWHKILALSAIEKKLVACGYSGVKHISSIEILDRDASDRVGSLKITSNKGIAKISAKDLRNFIGPNEIRSTNFTVRVVDQTAFFDGLGWGHGVGLCQWGAYAMARQGYRYSEILEYYYPGSVLVKLK